MDIITLIGTIGMVLLLISFVLIITKKIKPNSVIYLLLNIFGCGLLFYYAIALNSIPFIILEAVWVATALYQLVSH